MTKTSSRIAVCAALLFVAMPISAVAANSAGTSCKKAGALSGTARRPLVCRRVNGKLAWKPSRVSSTTTITIPTAPITPTLVGVTMKSPFDGTGTLTWIRTGNEDNFYISNIDPTKLVGLPLTSIWYKASKGQISVTITGFQNGYTYCYWGMASNAIGNSAWSGPVCTLAGTATTTTTAYVPPTTAYVPPTTAYVPGYIGGGGSSTNWLGCYFKGQKMWGSVYITASSWAADFIVYQTSSSWSSDLKVYTTPSSWAANSCGIWYITSSSWAADFTIYLTSSSWNADFTIYSTSSSWSAGR